MSITLARRTERPKIERSSERAGVSGRRADLLAGALLALLFAVMATLTWRKWGVPEIDAGAELTTADLIAQGESPYDDVRYFYGPLGLYGLALTFKVFGTSFAAAYGFGLVQAAAILAAFYALARHWLRPLPSALSTAVVLAIGFSGTAFNFVLPHTNSATLGILFLLAVLLALARGGVVLAGIALGLVALTRPEFAVITLAVAAAWVAGTWREQGRAAALDGLRRLAPAAVGIPVLVYGVLAAQAGAARLLTENLWPVDFIRVAGFGTQRSWMPLTPESVIGLGLRAVVYGGLLAALVATAVQWRRRGPRAAWPLVAVPAGLLLADGFLAATGLLEGQRVAIEAEVRHLAIGMSWLPALAFAVAGWAAVRFGRRESSPLGGSWPVDLALVVAAAALGLRAYNAFTTEASYAAYYAAPLVLLLGILHTRIGERLPPARVPVMAALGLVALGLASYSLLGLYADQTQAVNTPRGSFVTTPAAATALQGAVDGTVEATRPGERILAAPVDGGLYFMTETRPALYEVMLLPGLLDSNADERAAVAALRRDGVRVAVVAVRDFSAWGWPTFGVDYNQTLGGYLENATVRRTLYGSAENPQPGTNPSRGIELLGLDAARQGLAVHVSRRGCDDRRGLRSARQRTQPVCSIERALDIAPPGWRVSVGAGSYPRLVVPDRTTRDVTVSPAGDGAVRLPGIEVGSEARGVAFEGLELAGYDRGPSFLVNEDAADIRLADSRVTGRRQHAIELRSGVSGVTIKGNRIHTEGAGSGVVLSSQANVPGVPAEVDPMPPIRDVVIRGNRFDGIALDGVRPANFENLLVAGNDFSGIDETGGHNDVLQTVWGGRGLTFRDNVIHDNTGQGLFVKDGRVHDLTVSGNLFVRNRSTKKGAAPAAHPLNLYDVVGLSIFSNTFWHNDSAMLLRNGLRRVTIENNLIETLVVDPDSVAALRDEIDQDYNLVSGGWSWGSDGAVGAHDIAAAGRASLQPRFVDPEGLDYRLQPASPGSGAGRSPGGGLCDMGARGGC